MRDVWQRLEGRRIYLPFTIAFPHVTRKPLAPKGLRVILFSNRLKTHSLTISFSGNGLYRFPRVELCRAVRAIAVGIILAAHNQPTLLAPDKRAAQSEHVLITKITEVGNHHCGGAVWLCE